jgi:hypothetical protein
MIAPGLKANEPEAYPLFTVIEGPVLLEPLTFATFAVVVNGADPDAT